MILPPTMVEEIVKLLRAEEPLARPANGRQRLTRCTVTPIPLTNPPPFDIVQFGPG